MSLPLYFDPASQPADAVDASLVQCLAHTPLAAVALFDASDRLVWANARYDALYLRGLSGTVFFADLLRHGFHQGFGVKIDSGDIEQFLADILPRRRQKAYRAFATDLVDGSWLWMTETLLPCGTLMSVAVDISSLKAREHSLQQAHDEALHLTRVDALTGAASRPYVLERAEAALERMPLDGPVSVVLMDLDHFKRINDGFGHHVGDEVLRDFVEQCRHLLRPGDLLGRWGGEEFLLLLRHTSLQGARTVVERLRDRPRAGHLPAYTFSAGMAQAMAAEAISGLLRRADVALYQAKEAGRDRLVMSEPDPAP